MGVLCASLLACAPQSWIEVLSVSVGGRDPDGDGTLATARPLHFTGGIARVSAGIALDESLPGLLRSLFDLRRGNFAPAPSEVDIFALGELTTGDEVKVNLMSIAEPIGQLLSGSDQALVVMLLSADEAVVGFPEARGIVIQEPGSYFLAVVPAVVGAPYDLEVRLRGPRTPEPSRGQVILLEFGGGQDLDLVIPTGRLAVRLDSLPPFDLSATNSDLAGSEALVKQTVRQTVEAIYADYALTVVTDRQEAERLGPHNTVVITGALASDILGNLNTSIAGIEPRVDFENSDIEGVGLVFAGLQAFRPIAVRGARMAGVQLGMIVAHELGHAVGLLHVVESSGGLMRPVLAVDALTRGETLPALVRARLAETRIGIQDAPAYLARVIGVRDPAEAEAIRQAALELTPLDPGPTSSKPRAEMMEYRCWRCGR